MSLEFRSEIQPRKEGNRMDKELVVTFRWDATVGNLLPGEINRILNTCADQLVKVAGKPIETATFEFAGKTHNVPIKTYSAT